jgi:peptidoglycan/LPS O-acetylase OafA/YrhL
MLQIPFEWRISQYLGDLSFGIYAMHAMLMWVFYDPHVEPFRVYHFGEGYWSGLPGMVAMVLVVLWCADWFSRIDAWVVWFGKWLETKAFIRWEDGS